MWLLRANLGGKTLTLYHLTNEFPVTLRCPNNLERHLIQFEEAPFN